MEFVAQALMWLVRIIFDVACLYTGKFLLHVFSLGKVQVVLPMQKRQTGRLHVGGDVAAFTGLAFWVLALVIAIMAH